MDESGFGLTDGPAPARRLVDLRSQLRERGLSGFLLPRTDEYQGEFIPLRAERLWWLTGFSGSAGFAIIAPDQAVVCVDGRYTLQVRDQTNARLFARAPLGREAVMEQISTLFSKGDKIGYDPWLHTASSMEWLTLATERAGAELTPVSPNPVDTIWLEQPTPPMAPVVAHPLDFAGESATSKRSRLAKILRDEGADTAVLTASDSLAWLLNIRGGDVPNSPLALGYALLQADTQVDLFMDTGKQTPEVLKHLEPGVRWHPEPEFKVALAERGRTGQRILVDNRSCPVAVLETLKGTGAEIIQGEDPCIQPRACKNPVELGGMRAAHRRDGAAMVKFLAWLSEAAPHGRVTELDVVRQLRAFRAEASEFHSDSFATIAGAGPHGAIVHYHATERTDRSLRLGDLLLLDSGGQYPDGTTDITRTVAVGQPSPEMRTHFTLVLKGHIALATARFPKGTTGAQLDALARTPLWEAGLDYAHGTGHGVGCYLNVHEGPQAISPRGGEVPLQPGMVLSNEPGYYRADHYGIRIENLMAVVEQVGQPHQEQDFYGFEILTLVPLDLSLVSSSLLTESERDWLNTYHARVRREISPLVEGATKKWLKQTTEPIE